MTVYSVVLFAHVLSGVALVGGAFFSVQARNALRSARSAEAIRAWAGLVLHSTRLSPLWAMVLLGSGIYLGLDGYWTAGWFYVSCALWLLNSVWAAHALKRHALQLEAALGTGKDRATDGALEGVRRSSRWEIVADIHLANDVVGLYLMLEKPDLLPSLVAVAIAYVALTGLGLAWRARSASARPKAEAQTAG